MLRCYKAGFNYFLQDFFSVCFVFVSLITVIWYGYSHTPIRPCVTLTYFTLFMNVADSAKGRFFLLS